MDSVVQPEASVVQTGLGIRYVGNYAMAYSGLVEADNSLTYLLDFFSGSGIIKCKIQFNIDEPGGGEAFEHQIWFNELIVQGYLSPGGTDTTGRPDIPIWLIIPPDTHVQCTSKNIQDSASRKCIASLTGRVYGAK